MKNPFTRSELVALVLAPAASVALFSTFDVVGWWFGATGSLEAWALDDVPAAVFGLAIGFLCIAAHRCHVAGRKLRGQKEIEDALRDSEARFRAIYDNAGAGILLASPEGTILAANAAFRNIVGYDEAELRRVGWQKLIHSEDDSAHGPRPGKPNDGGPVDNSIERCFVRKNGDPVWVKLTTSYAFDKDGRPILGIAVAEDVTARRRAEETLRNAHDELERRVVERTRQLQDEIAERTRAEAAVRESERKFRALIENALDFITIIDEDAVIRFQSPSIENVLGLPPEHFLGISCFDFIHREDVFRVKEEFYAKIRTPGATAFLRFRVQHADGSWRLMEAIAKNLVHDPVVKGVVINPRDITVREQAERQAHRLQSELAHVARLSTMGEMAAGFAHELNQPLTAIHNYARGCVRRLRSGAADIDEVCSAMESAANQAHRAGEIIRRIRWFLRRDEPELTPTDLNAVIREAVNLMESDARHAGVIIHLDLAACRPWVTGDVIQLQQMLVNFARNGIEAMIDDDQGPRELTIRTARLDDGNTEVSVHDTGPGIPAEIRGRLFDPFFTTKSQGMGMGLAICRSIIERHRGQLRVESNGARGTVFRVKLPGCDAPPLPAGAPIETSRPAVGDFQPRPGDTIN